MDVPSDIRWSRSAGIIAGLEGIAPSVLLKAGQAQGAAPTDEKRKLMNK